MMPRFHGSLQSHDAHDAHDADFRPKSPLFKREVSRKIAYVRPKSSLFKKEVSRKPTAHFLLEKRRFRRFPNKKWIFLVNGFKNPALRAGQNRVPLFKNDHKSCYKSCYSVDLACYRLSNRVTGRVTLQIWRVTAFFKVEEDISFSNSKKAVTRQIYRVTRPVTRFDNR